MISTLAFSPQNPIQYSHGRNTYHNIPDPPSPPHLHPLALFRLVQRRVRDLVLARFGLLLHAPYHALVQRSTEMVQRQMGFSSDTRRDPGGYDGPGDRDI